MRYIENFDINFLNIDRIRYINIELIYRSTTATIILTYTYCLSQIHHKKAMTLLKQMYNHDTKN